MSGQVRWLAVFLLAGAFAAVLAARLIRRRAGRGLREVKTDFVCPAIGRSVEVMAVQERATGLYAGIRSCSALQPGEKVRCSQGCVKALNAAASKGPAPLSAGR